MTINKIAYIYK